MHYVAKLLKNHSKPRTKASGDKETQLKWRYKPLDEVTALAPCIVIDMQGVILAWYLPGILSDSRQVRLLPCLIVAENLICVRMQC